MGIKVVDCCSLCEFSESININCKKSKVLYCNFLNKKVYSHEFCDNFLFEDNALDLPSLESDC